MKNFITRYEKVARLRGVSCGTIRKNTSQNMAKILLNLSISAKQILFSTNSCIA